MGKYEAKYKMIEDLDAKLIPLTLELFDAYIEDKLWKGDITPSMLAMGVVYKYNTKGFRFDSLRSIAEQKRKIFLAKIQKDKNVDVAQ